MFIISDLDGTLALIDHRRHLIDRGAGKSPDWDGFFRACVDDAPHWPVIRAFAALADQEGVRAEIWSGRSDLVRRETEIWLESVGLGHLPLRMRRNGDYTPDQVLKAGWLAAEPIRPDLVFDDRDKVVAMWRDHGITCAQVAPGHF